MLSGHTHGGQVVLPVVGPVYSPSLHGVKYASGLFRYPECTLHVSRGLGSKDPLRWNCTPELTWLQIEIPQ
jgi:predicted MPP superfamily phosphohydrolase